MSKERSSDKSLIRKKAEAKVREQEPVVEQPLSWTDSLRLLHELQVHQIELEIQNEELKNQRDQAETATRKYSDLYSEIYDFTPLGYFKFSGEGKILEINLSGSKLLDTDRSQLIRSNFRTFLAGESFSVFNEFLNSVFNKKVKSSCEVIIQKKDSSSLYVHIEGTLSENDNCCLAMAADISEIKKMELDLRESEEILNDALENGNIGVWHYDLSSGEMIWDERMERIHGIIKGSFGKTFAAFEKFLFEQDIPYVTEAFRRARENNIPFETVYRISLGNGSIKYVNSKARLKAGRNGRLSVMSGVCFDVTGMKQGAEQVLLKLNEELLRSNRELESFAYIASHDLQEPLRMVSSFVQMLSQRYEDKLDDQAREYIKFAVEGSKRMYDLLNGLLAYSRVQTKGKKFSEVNMNKVLEKVSDNLGLNIKERNATVSVSDLPVVFADESQMIQLMQNLLANAIKFSGNAPSIRVSAKPEAGKYIFWVEDKGIGIEPQYFERIFRIFQRLVPKEEYEGTGLGLAICKRIVERHGGDIWVDSEPGKGSTFKFSIPFEGAFTTA